MALTAPRDVLLDRQVEIETPEHVALGYELAGLGSRFAALFVDSVILFASWLAIVVGAPLLATRIGSVPQIIATLGVAASIILAFAMFWGYFVYFEGLRDGQTPGKKLLRIRTVHDGGFPLTVRGAAVRNLVRFVDAQPLMTWMVGGATMLFHSRTKRLGDLAAGTIVVRERVVESLPEEVAPIVAAGGAPRLNDGELATLAQYVARRDALAAEVRERLAERLLAGLEHRVPDDERRRTLPADRYLVLLHREEVAKHVGAGGGTASGSPQAAALVRHQRQTWEEYRRLVERAQRRGLHHLTEIEVSRFATLYRVVSADLARVRTYGGSPELVYSLERWVGAGHNLLYRPPKRSWSQLKAWFTGGFPALVRMRWRPIVVAAAFFYLPAVATFAAVHAEPTRAYALLSTEMVSRAEEGAGRKAQGKGYIEIPQVYMPVMASGIIANNVQVTFMAFAGGIMAGLGTLMILIINGVHLGAVAGLFDHHDANLYLWSFVLPHGIIELTAICIAGGAGLWLGSAILLPGRRTRREALVIRGKEAVSLLAGTVLLLLVAGVIEGFISPAPIPDAMKLGFALCFALILVTYLVRAGRDEASRQSAEAAAV